MGLNHAGGETMSTEPMILPIRPLRTVREISQEYAERVANEHLELTIDEVAKLLGVGRATLYRWLAKRKAVK